MRTYNCVFRSKAWELAGELMYGLGLPGLAHRADNGVDEVRVTFNDPTHEDASITYTHGEDPEE